MANATITAPQGFRCSGLACGIKPSGRPDLAVLAADVRCAAAAMFTTNRFCGAPVVIARRHVADGRLQAVVVNSGNANVATGPRGLRDAQAMCRRLAGHLGIDPRDVLPASTGLIGQALPMRRILAGIDRAAGGLSASARAGRDFARAIMTTDRRPKQAIRRVRLGRRMVSIAGCAKGSGMIAPRLATMLCYITTDAAISPPVLRALLRMAVEATLNRVSVDECTSTSDMVAILASGLAENGSITDRASAAGRRFGQALREVCEELAWQIAADGEGATKVIEVQVRAARSARDAHVVARAIAASPLLKAAINGADANWGRIIQAIGATDAVFEPGRVSVRLGRQRLFARGRANSRASAAALAGQLRGPAVRIVVDLGAGRAADRILTCDLSERYVRINAGYRT